MQCNQCSLSSSGCRAPVSGRGRFQHPLVFFVGEAPGSEEDRLGTAFVGKSGIEVSNYLRRSHIDEDLCYFDNTVRCRPPQNRTPKNSEIEACYLNVVSAIFESEPRHVVALGGVAATMLAGFPVDMERQNGFVMPSRFGFDFMPIFHPAFGIHDPRKMTDLFFGFANLAKWTVGVGGQLPKPPKMVFKHLQTAAEVAETFAHDPKFVAIDTETENDVIWCLSYCTGELDENGAYVGFVIKVESTDAIAQLSRSLTWATPILHNAQFDIPLLRSVGIDFRKPVHDTMLMANLLQDVPKGLKSLAFRLLGMPMRDYSDVIENSDDSEALSHLVSVFCSGDYPSVPVIEGWAIPEDVKKIKQNLTKLFPTYKFPKPKKGQEFDWRGVLKSHKKTYNEYRDYIDAGLYPIVKVLRGASEIAGDVISKSSNPFSYAAKVGSVDENYIRKFGNPPQKCLRFVPDWLEYSGMDAVATRLVFDVLYERIKADDLTEPYLVDAKLIPYMVELNRVGIPVDVPALKSLSVVYGERIAELSKQIVDVSGLEFNINSPSQLSDVLFNKLGLRTGRRTDTGFSTDEDELIRLEGCHPVVPLILQYRKMEKFRNTYIDVLPICAEKDGRVHSTFNLTVAVTGRLSSKEPNLMNQPKRDKEAIELRKCFVASPGCVLSAGDYSQIELRVSAHLSDDESLLEAFNSGVDVHTATAAAVFGVSTDAVSKEQRNAAKVVNFGIIYGVTPSGLSGNLREVGIDWDERQCADFIREYFKLRKGLYAFIKDSEMEARRFGYVKDMFGRKRLLPEVRSDLSWVVGAGLRQATNTKVQSTAQGIIKRAMVQMLDVIYEFRKKTTCNPLIQIHDDLLDEVGMDFASDFTVIKKSVMENVVKLKVPVLVDFSQGLNWGEMKSIKEGGEK